MFRILITYPGSDQQTIRDGFDTYGQVSGFSAMLPQGADFVIEKNVDNVWSSQW